MRLFVPPVLHGATDLLYYGLHWMCKLVVLLTLVSATAPAPKLASVWIGAQTPHASRWVQAGIYKQGLLTWLYVEWNRGSGPRLLTFPWAHNLIERAHLQHRKGGYWRAEIGTMRTPWLHLRRVKRCTVMELRGGSHAVALVGAQVIRG